MLYAYDLDGTLADTYEAVRRSYIEAGATLPSRVGDWWGKPWRHWLDDKAVHDRKNKIYADHVAGRVVKPLPMLDLFKLTGGDIITGASMAGAKATLRALGIDPETVQLSTNLNTIGKATVLNRINPDGGIYFDDDLDAGDMLRVTTEWRIVCVTQ